MADAPAWMPPPRRPPWPARAWDHLTQPAAIIADAPQRRRARLLSAILLLFIPLSLAAALATPLLAPQPVAPVANPVILVGLASTAMGLVLYAVSRTRHHRAAAAFTVLTAAAAIWAVTLTSPVPEHALAAPYFLGIPLLLGAVLLPFAFTAAFAAATVAGLAALAAAHPLVTPLQAVNATILVALTTACLGAHAYVRRHDRIQIDAQARAIEQSEQRYRDLFESDPDGVVVICNDLILDANPAAHALLNAPAEALHGRTAAELIPPTALQDGHRADILLPGPNADPRHVEVHTTRHDQGDHVLHLVTMRDVTDRRAAETARRLAYERDAEIRRLQGQNEFKTRLLNTASHELSTPLTAITLQLHALRAPAVQEDAARRQRVLEILDRNIDRLSQLVQDTLDVARLDADRLTLRHEPLDLALLLRETLDTFQPLLRERRLGFSHDIPLRLPVVADAARLCQILYNLLSNAAKFTEAGGSVSLTVHAEDDRVTVRVADTGLGIDPDAQGRLFAPFTQVHDPMRVTASGTGLGLYISRGLARRHGGDLVLERSGPGEGTVFALHLPRTPAQNANVIRAGPLETPAHESAA